MANGKLPSNQQTTVNRKYVSHNPARHENPTRVPLMCDPISDSLRNLLDRALAGEKSSCAKLSALFA